MLEKVTLKNFQSHEDTSIVLHPGVNSLEGNSDCGKTAIIRALRWAMCNESNGLRDVSFWAMNAKGDDLLKGRVCSVSVELDGSDEIVRSRGNGFNGYRMNVAGRDETYEACKTDVPKDVADTFNVGDVNLQKQQEGPFFLSDKWTPGARARYVNKLVNLDEIDAAMQECSAMTRDNTARRKVNAEEMAKAKVLVELTAEADRLPSIVDELDALNKESSDVEAVLGATSESIVAYNVASSLDLELAPLSDELERALAELDEMGSTFASASSSFNDTSRSLADYAECSMVCALDDCSGSLLSCVDDIFAMDKEMGRLMAIVNGRGDEANYMRMCNMAELASRSDSLDAILSELSESDKELNEAGTIVGTLTHEFAKMDSCDSTIDEAEREYDCCKEELSTMACPLCGHVGCSC